ncbi:nectin-1-like isoform X1 [Hemiscyllium ocellatum]|uniref:nectin-1-like isoform X1 n=1 Tax=Hemiscyllium ocellatum TaxID=170820 RepID=UPI002966AEDA|nr:nectin-1-like isoform X1 [Hemiscyllium ocellatum]
MSQICQVLLTQLAISTAAIAQRIIVADFMTGIAGEQLDLPCLFIYNETSLRVVQATWLKRGEGTDENIAVYNPLFGMSYPTRSGRIRFHNATSGNCTLTVHPLKLEDQGVYSCEVNVFPSGKFESRTELKVLVRPIGHAIAMPTEIGRSEAPVANCTAANGKPAADVTWIAKLQGRVTSTQRENPNGTVTVFSQYRIIPSRKANGQNVTCVVSHDALTAPLSLPVTLSVLYPPDVRIIGYDGNWQINQHNVSLSCLADANPPATSYHWTMSSGVVPERARIAGDQLIIDQVDYSVNGTWICEATNELGKGRGEIVIVVREPDSLRAGKLYGSTIVFIVTGTIIGTLIIIVSLAIVIAKKQKTIEDGKSDARPITRKRSHITVFATLNLNVLDGASSSKTEVNETGATVNADVNVN